MLPTQGFFHKLRVVMEMIKIEHTLFALPFAFMGAVLAEKKLPSLAICGWILVAMVGARSAAMAFNRLVDRHFDAKNPRTASRAIPAGLISLPFVIGFTIVSSLLLIGAAARLNPLCLALSPLALLLVFFYSFTKRFTAWSHAWLGLALAVAPMGAWLAVTGAFALPPFFLCAAVVCWLIGFDTLYALQDVDFDQKAGLHSLPVKLGPQRALKLARWFHAGMVLCLVALGYVHHLGLSYGIGVALSAILIAYEHAIIAPDDLKKLNVAFFNVNITISTGLLFFTLLDVLIR
jgi:4-hydroxybenzoate polyprenyltransferase